ncbi:MAG TPA: hypothetical protein PLH11_08970 [Gemmobacter sp.]|nr:hypothetical protein [Gemmobacter sp.]
MSWFLSKLAAAIRRNSTKILIFLFTLMFFALLSGYAIEEKSILSRMWIGGVSFFVGVATGGLLGFLVGGIGIVAMGTGIGIPALAVSGIGALIGGVFFGAVGTGIGAYLSDPSRYEVNKLMLLGLLVVSFLASALVVFCCERLGRWLAGRRLLMVEFKRVHSNG